MFETYLLIAQRPRTERRCSHIKGHGEMTRLVMAMTRNRGDVAAFIEDDSYASVVGSVEVPFAEVKPL